MKKIKKFLSALLGLLLFGCTPVVGDTVLPTTNPRTEQSEQPSEQTKIITDDLPFSEETVDPSALSKFMFEHLSLLAEEENLLFSPLSAAVCLGMLANGADGNTRTQIENAYGMTVEELNTSLVSYIKNLYTAEDCKVSLADSVWIRDIDGFAVDKDFSEKVASAYRAGLYTAPFDQTTVDRINEWVSDNTDGLITDLLDEIAPEAMMYLINTLLFDAQWEKPFSEADIYDEYEFTNEDKTKSKATMLGFTTRDYFHDEDTEGTSLIYAGGRYSLMVFMQKKQTDMPSYLRSFTAEKWEKLLDSNTRRETVIAKLPEFTCRSDIKLNDTWQAMGMTDMFGDLADFSLLSDTPLYCSRAFQKCYIDVSRQGTKAAAASGIEMNFKSAYEPRPEKIYLTFDRPFFYAIVDTENNLPLFYGCLTQLK